MKLYIHNCIKAHYEIIESVISKYDKIIGIPKSKDDTIVLGLVNHDRAFDFSNYFKQKYPHIKIIGYSDNQDLFPFCNDADYYIECSMYPGLSSIPEEYRDENRYFYIRHNIREKFKDHKNVFYLTPLGGERYFYADVLPWSNLTEMASIPTYIVSGSYSRRRWELIQQVLECEELKDIPFKIKAIGFGVKNITFTDERLSVKAGLPFKEYHEQFLDCYAIMPLVTKEKNPEYYKTSLTSSIHYARAYNLKAILDRDLQDIYNLEDVEVYDQPDHFVKAFHKTLKEFHNAEIMC